MPPAARRRHSQQCAAWPGPALQRRRRQPPCLRLPQARTNVNTPSQDTVGLPRINFKFQHGAWYVWLKETAVQSQDNL
jgi:hypothetical protein